MNGGQVQRSGAHTALCTLKYLRTCKRENSVTCVTTRYKTWNKRGYVNRSKQMGSFEKRRSLVHDKGRKRNGRSKVKNKQTNKYRQMGRRTDRWPDRQTDRKTNRHTEILVKIQLTVRQTQPNTKCELTRQEHLQTKSMVVRMSMQYQPFTPCLQLFNLVPHFVSFFSILTNITLVLQYSEKKIEQF